MATDANNSGDSKDVKVTFSEEQQTKVNDLIREAQGRAAKEVKAELDRIATEKQALESKVSELEQAVKSATKPKGGTGDDLEALKAQIAEAKSLVANKDAEVERFKAIAIEKESAAKKALDDAMNVRKTVAVTNAASKIAFVDIGVVTKLTEDAVKWDADRGKFVVLNDGGSPRLNSAFEEMSLDEFYNDFAVKNPYLVRGSFKGGAGSSESARTDVSANGKYTVDQIFGLKADARLATQLYKSDPAEYQRLKGIAKEKGLVA